MYELTITRNTILTPNNSRHKILIEVKVCVCVCVICTESEKSDLYILLHSPLASYLL